jgi:hypothetical protein
MKIAFDLDNTVITQGSPDLDYKDSLIKRDMVNIVNKLYDEGHEIYFFTARHFKHFKYTKEFLDQCNFRYTGLVMNKISCDLYVDDKGFRWDDSKDKQLFDLVRMLDDK